jgi:hypothetical protein
VFEETTEEMFARFVFFLDRAIPEARDRNFVECSHLKNPIAGAQRTPERAIVSY